MSRTTRFAAVALMLLTAACASTPKVDQASLFVGGGVYGHDGANAVYVVNGTVKDVGRSEELRHRFPLATVIDTPGSTILPGLIDAHAHLYGLGLALDVVALAGTNSYAEVIERTKARLGTGAPGDWILGRGWDQNRWPEKEFPTSEALDAAIPDRPVWLKRVDGHAAIANSAAMKVAGISASTPDPEGGRILRDASGKPTGVFVDAAMSLVESRIPPPSFELRKERVREAALEIARHGLTEIHDAGAEDSTIQAVKQLVDEGRFPIRVYVMLTDDDELLRKYLAAPPIIGYGGKLTVRSIKLYADGALGSRGAALHAPYSDDRGNSGLMIARPAHIADVARRARAAGFQVNSHAIGDRGVSNVIDGYETAGVSPADRFRVEHFQVAAPADFGRMAKNGIIASMQPTHATSDMPWAERRVGPERILGAYAWRTVLESGARLALGSDFPVEDVNPFFGIYSAVSRQDQTGKPPGGWYPAQRLTLHEAIDGFTRDAAYAAFEEDSRGRIEAGLLADFTIVDGNIITMPVSELWKAKVRKTVVGGEVVFSAD